jgi:heme-degrading monooxygenase HmoA
MSKFRAIHTIDLKPEVKSEDFEKFMLEEFIPETLKLKGCLGVQLLKGYKGDLVGVAKGKSDYAWISLWESVEANNKAWTKRGKHFTPESIVKANAKLYDFAATFWLVGGYTIVGEENAQV